MAAWLRGCVAAWCVWLHDCVVRLVCVASWCGAWCVMRGVRDVWCVVRDAWCVVRGAWCVVRGAWCVVRGAWCAWCVVRGVR